MFPRRLTIQRYEAYAAEKKPLNTNKKEANKQTNVCLTIPYGNFPQA
jgi:hypothetical protein